MPADNPAFRVRRKTPQQGMIPCGGVRVFPPGRALFHPEAVDADLRVFFARTQYGLASQPGAAFPDLWISSVGLNYYIDGHDAKLSTDLGVSFSSISFVWDNDLAGWRVDGRRDEPQFLFRLQYQLLF